MGEKELLEGYVVCMEADAREGHKIDAIRRNEKVSFCVASEDEVMLRRKHGASKFLLDN